MIIYGCNSLTPSLTQASFPALAALAETLPFLGDCKLLLPSDDIPRGMLDENFFWCAGGKKSFELAEKKIGIAIVGFSHRQFVLKICDFPPRESICQWKG